MGMLPIDDRVFLIFEDDRRFPLGPIEDLSSKGCNGNLIIVVCQYNDWIPSRIFSSAYAHVF